MSGGADGSALKAWRAARAQAKERLSKDVVGKKVLHRDGTTSMKYPVKVEQLNKLARQIYQSGQYKEKFGHSPKPKGTTQSPSERNVRRHGLSTRDLHKPVTRAEAIKLFLEGYARQAREGHVVNASGNRKYPTSGPVAARVSAEKRGTPVPTRTVKSFVHPSQALRSRIRRSAGSPVTTKSPKRGSPYSAVGKGKTHRRLINACPDGTKTAAQAKKANCSDSWRLRENRGWKDYQVQDVSYFSSASEARSSPLYRQAKKLESAAPRKNVDPVWLKPYQRRKGQKKDEYNARIKTLKPTSSSRAMVPYQSSEDTEL